MSDSPDTSTGDVEMMAAEYVLGVLDAPARREAERRIVRDAAFARDVEAWAEILTPMALATAPMSVPIRLWGRIALAINAKALETGDGRAEVIDLALRRSLRLWRGAAAGAAAMAAVLLATVLWPRAPVTMVPPAAPSHLQPLLVARLKPIAQGPTFFASLDRNTRELVVMPAGSRRDTDHTPELWLIPAGEKPISIGLLSLDQPVSLPAAASVGAVGRLTLAVTMEPLNGSPTGKPTGPVVASGVLTRL
jgi:anti-sigma-K factor RskA